MGTAGSSNELCARRSMRPRPGLGTELVPAVLLLVALCFATLGIVGPALDRVDEMLFRRRAALAGFADLAAEVESVRGLEASRRDAALGAIGVRLAELQSLWRDAEVCAELLPVLETRPIGPLLVLADVGPGLAEVVR